MKLYGAKNCSTSTLLAHVLNVEYGIAPLPDIVRAPEGKPYFPSLPALHFNLSHTGPYVLCGISDRPIGVDMEQIRPRRDSLPRYALTSEEYIKYQAMGGDWPAFYALWTRKEAWCKYTGQGLRLLWGTPPPEGLQFGSYAGDNWRAAVCGEKIPPEKILWQKDELIL